MGIARSQRGHAPPSIQAMSVGPSSPLGCLGQRLGIGLAVRAVGGYFPMDSISPAHSHSFFSLIRQL